MDIQKLLDNLTEEVSCSVCGDIYKEPKQLPCLHSFCLVCLNNLSRTRAVNGNIQCPLCQRQVAVPESGTFETFPSSFYINSLLDVLAIKQCSTSRVTCGNCSKKSEDSSYCFHCSQFWCGECLNAHNILQQNKDHRVVALKNFQAKDYEDVFKRPAICKKEHHNEMLKYYCKGCDVAACQVCVTLEHVGHDMRHLEVVSEGEKAKIAAQVEKAKNKNQEYAEHLQNNEGKSLDIQQRAEAVEQEVNNLADKMVRFIRDRQQELIAEAQIIKKTSQDGLKIKNEQLQIQYNEIQSAINWAENLVLRGASAEIVGSRQQVVRQLEKLVAEQPEIKPAQVGKLCFAEHSLLVGSLNTAGIGRLGKSFTDPVQSTAEGEGLAKAITGLEAQFVVTTRNSKGDVCYSPVDRIAAEIKPRLGEDAVQNVQVQDNKNGTYRVSYFAADPGDHEMHVTVNREEVRGSPFSPIHVKPREFKPVMSFGTKGSTIPGEFDCPWGVAVSEDDEIAVTDQGNHRVQVFSKEGKFLLSFGREGSDQGQLLYPCGVTYDEDGNLLVVDKDNHRIQQFTGRGQFMRTFETMGELDRLSYPRGLSTCPNGNIVVSDRDRKRVVVLSPEGHTLQMLKDDTLSPSHCIYHDSRFFVSCTGGNCIEVFSKQGDFLYRFGAENGELNFPVGVAIDKSGRLVVCDSNNCRIQLFKLDGTLCGNIRNLNHPVSVDVLQDGKFAVTEWDTNCVRIIQ